LNTATPRIFTEQNYACQSCGKGCRTSWKIKVDEGRVPQIQVSRGFQKAKNDGYVPLPLINGERQVGRSEDGACVFLRNNLCEIHSEFGLKAKPEVCQLYPFSHVNTPAGNYFSVSFSCPAVLENAGVPVQEHLYSVEETLQESATHKQPMPADTLIPITSDVGINWSRYLELEEQLLDYIGVENPVKDLLFAAATLLAQCQSGKELNLRAETQSQALLSEVLALYAPMTVHTIAQLEGLEVGREGFRGLALLEENHGFQSSLLEAPLPPFNVHRPTDHACSEALDRYFKNLIIGKQLIHAGTLVTRLLLLASAIGVHLYYLDFQRTLAQNETVTFEQLLWSFDLIEVQLVTHSEKQISLFSDFERTLSSVAPEGEEEQP
jgi:Fe-S-cluster containining protein